MADRRTTISAWWFDKNAHVDNDAAPVGTVRLRKRFSFAAEA
jgi:hypothetical protein